MNKEKIQSFLIDIRVWIVFFFLIRLIGITNAPLEIGHNWRQSLTNMISRNFYENGLNIFFPVIDIAGEKSGIIGSEFPFFNFLIYLFAEVFNYSHWHGRLINLIVSSIGIFFFYKLIKKIYRKKIAFNATIILLSSIWFAFSRKIMPDTFSVALVIIGLYYAYSYLKENNKYGLILFFLFTTTGMLCKIPALSLLSVLGIIIFIKEIPQKKIIIIFITSTVSVFIVAFWYFYWVPYLVNTYKFQLFFPKGIIEGVNEIMPLIPEALEKFYFSSLQSYIAFMCFIAGLFFIIKSKNKILIMSVSIICITFLIFIIKTGAVFPLHNYYIIPFAPVMAFIAAFSLSKLKKKYQYLLLCVIAIEGIANQQNDFFIQDRNIYKLELEEITNKNIAKNDLIIINGGESPQHMYFSHRKGWTVESEKLNDMNFIDSLSTLGANILVIDKNKYQKEIDFYPLKFSDKNYSIYEL